MAVNYGKKFEEQFKSDWLKSFPNTFCVRIPDQQSMYKSASQNICDFICFNNKTLYLLECKSHKGNTFPFSCLRQYDLLVKYTKYENTKVGVVLWFIEHEKVLYIPIEEIVKMKQDGKKSINIKMLEEKVYDIIDIPSIKKRTFLNSDYTILNK